MLYRKNNRPLIRSGSFVMTLMVVVLAMPTLVRSSDRSPEKGRRPSNDRFTNSVTAPVIARKPFHSVPLPTHPLLVPEKVEQRFLEIGINALIAEYRAAEKKPENKQIKGFREIHEAILLSRTVLDKNPNQFRMQLQSRLVQKNLPCLRAFQQFPKKTAAIRAVWPSMRQVGGALRYEIKATGWGVLTPDGKSIVLTDRYQFIKIIDLATGELQRTFRHKTPTIAITPDGKSIISTGNDVRVWKIHGEKYPRTIAEFPHKKFRFGSIAVSPNGKLIAAACSDQTLKIWDFATGKLRHSLAGSTSRGMMAGVTFTPNGKWIVAADRDYSVKVWDIATGKQQRKLSIDSRNGLYAIAISPDGRFVVAGGSDKKLRVWNLNTGKLRHTFIGHANFIRCVAISPDGKWIVSTGRDSTFKFWNLSTGKLHHTLVKRKRMPGFIRVMIPPGGRTIITTGQMISVWNFPDQELKKETLPQIRLPQGFVRNDDSIPAGAVVTPNGRWAVSASRRELNAIKVWDRSTGKLQRTFSTKKMSLTGLTMSVDGQWILTTSWDHTVKIWNFATGKLHRTLKGHTKKTVRAVMSPDNRWIVSASDDLTIKIWHFETGRVLHILPKSKLSITDLTVSPDGKSIVSVGLDTLIKIWDIKTGKLKRTITTQQGKGRSPFYRLKKVLISPDGKWLVTASTSAQIQIRDFATGKLRTTLPTHQSGLNNMAISSDSRWVASVGGDRAVMVWELSTGKTKIQYHTDYPTVCLAFIPKSQELVVFGDSQKMHKLELLNLTTQGMTPISSIALIRLKAKWEKRVKRKKSQSLLEVRPRIVPKKKRTEKPKSKPIPKTVQQKVKAKHPLLVPENIEQQLKTVGFDKLIAAYRAAEKNPKNKQVKGLREVRHALILSEHVLRSHPEQLRAQLQSRLLSHQEPYLRVFQQFPANYKSLRAVWPSAIQAGGCLICRMKVDESYRDIEISPDEKFLVTGTYQKIFVREMSTRKLRYTLKSKFRDFRMVKISSDSRWLITVDEDKGSTIKLWDLATGKLQRTFRGHARPVAKVLMSADGRTLISQTRYQPFVRSADGRTLISRRRNRPTIKFWDLTTGKLKETVSNAFRIVLTPNKRWLLFKQAGKGIVVRNMQTGKIHRRLVGPGSTSINFFISSNSRKIVAYGQGYNTIKTWDIVTGKFQQTKENYWVSPNSLLGPEGRILLLRKHKHSREGKLLSTTLLFLNVLTEKIERTILLDTNSTKSERLMRSDNPFALNTHYCSLQIIRRKNQRTLLYEYTGQLIIIRDFNTGIKTGVIAGAFTNCSKLMFSQEGRRLISIQEKVPLREAHRHSQFVSIWDLSSSLEKSRKLTGHTGSVNRIAVSPDGLTLVSASDDKTIAIWNASTGKRQQLLHGHTEPINSVIFTSTGQQIISASDDKTIKLWDITTGKLHRTFTGHSSSVLAVAISPDGRSLVSASSDKTVKVWEIATGKLQRTLVGHTKDVADVVMSSTGTTIISCSFDNTIKTWDFTTGKLQRTLTGHTGPVRSVAIHPDGETIVSVGWDKTIRIWELSNGQLHRLLTDGHTDRIHSVAMSPDGHSLITGDETGKILVRNFYTGMVLQTIMEHSQRINKLLVMFPSRSMISASADSTIKIWKLPVGVLQRTTIGKPLRRIPYFMRKYVDKSSNVQPQLLSPHRRWTISPRGFGKKKTLCVWNVAMNRLQYQLVDSLGPTSKVVFNAHDDTFATFDPSKASGLLKVWETETGQRLLKFSVADKKMKLFALSADGEWIITVTTDSTIRTRSVRTGKVKYSLRNNFGKIYQLTITPNGKWMVLYHGGGLVQIRNIVTGKKQKIFSCERLGGHFKIALNSRIIATYTAKGTVNVWDCETGKSRHTTKLQQYQRADTITCRAISSDGKWIVMTDKKQTIFLWNSRTGKLIATYLLNENAKVCEFTHSERMIKILDEINRVHCFSW